VKAFLCHNSNDSAFVIEVAQHLQRNLDGVYYYEDYQRSNETFMDTINKELNECEVMVIFIGGNFSNWQVNEANAAHKIHVDGRPRSFFLVLLMDAEGNRCAVPDAIRMLAGYPQIKPETIDSEGAKRVAAGISTKLARQWQSQDDLPLNPNLFSYEKDIIEFFNTQNVYGDKIFNKPDTPQEEQHFKAIRAKLLEGCPPSWPNVTRWRSEQPLINPLGQDDVGQWRSEDAGVLTAALSTYNTTTGNGNNPREKINKVLLHFPEAGPRETLYFPISLHRALNVAVLVSGGIAPGINAVIDGIVQRHWLYAKRNNAEAGLTIYGLENGFRAFERLNSSHRLLAAEPDHYRGSSRRLQTSDHVHEGGSILGTSRVDELIDTSDRIDKLQAIDRQLLDWNIDILYIIGGDGSMKAAHALWSIAQENPERRRRNRPLSVVAIPKTMDNDILWVWQSFGFLSAVEKAREVIENLHTEVTSNPRLGVVQLFGSDSGFVVSHAVLASATGHCSLALIPEIEFNMKRVADYLKTMMCRANQNIPFGLIVMSETAIPTDAMEYAGVPGEQPLIDIGLSEEEKVEIRKFNAMRAKGERIQGQTNDALRTAGLKIVSRGLQKLLPDSKTAAGAHGEIDWTKLRILTNEPRHLLRAISPSCSDMIIGHRLGTLAVDNAMAGYTDFMISQWLTEYVLVPLKLVVLGRKRIPTSGIFWKSVLAKTGQPADLTDMPK